MRSDGGGRQRTQVRKEFWGREGQRDVFEGKEEMFMMVKTSIEEEVPKVSKTPEDERGEVAEEVGEKHVEFTNE